MKPRGITMTMPKNVLTRRLTGPSPEKGGQRIESSSDGNGDITRAKKSFRKRLFGLAALLTIFTIVPSVWYLQKIYGGLPDVDQLDKVASSIQIKFHKTAAEMPKGQSEIIFTLPIGYDDMPDHVRHALIAREDQEFFKHHGVSLKGIARMVLSRIPLMRNYIQRGGSTITQQLAKNLFLSGEKSLERKLKDMLLAIKLENNYSKEKIITMYLNNVPFGEGTHGIEAAALKYFGKHTRDLSVYETALLIGALKAPEADNIIDNPRKATQRADLIVAAMQAEGYVSIDFEPQRNIQRGDDHLSKIDRRALYDSIKEETGIHVGDATGVFTVITTLCPEFQIWAEDAFQGTVRAEWKKRNGIRIIMPICGIFTVSGFRRSQWMRA